ncbi:hypothetical protein JK636_14710 [Clostridium sp. YIM B02515]|uniref:HIT domain-containing protein n=1 Tax=Clostridium rhizosphaerae TaxID=2803861 RepID=A0ABS1TCB8_9CLOT|nr:hypothetical protein [Clostridium rhizosphaerae]MBL4937003.1 hypothetical protein [Clostridium rhizosphaerae]
MSIVAEAGSNVLKLDKMNYELIGNECHRIHWHVYLRMKGDTPVISSIYQLPNSILFDESSRPSDDVRKDNINRIKNEIERLLAL